MVDCPDMNMPTELGPFAFSAAFHFSAITSKAWSQLTGVNSPFLSYRPPFILSSGRVKRSSPYMILERKYPFTQLTPRLTSDCWSPCVATTWPSFTATVTPQPTPQKRHGAFDHLRCDAFASVTTFVAATGSGAPSAA